jgi:acyl-CoA thioesterase
MSFDEYTAVRLREAGHYDGELNSNHWVINGPNGGYLAAILARAGDEHVGEPARQLRSLTTHFLRPPKIGPVRIEVVTEQLGRTVAYLRLKMLQGEKTVLLATGAWATARESIEYVTEPAPSFPDPEQCDSISHVRKGSPLAIHGQWDIRNASGHVFGSGDAPDMSWWIRPRVAQPLDAPLMVAISDALPPPIFVTIGEPMAVPTVDLTVHLRADLSKINWQPDDWVLARFKTQQVSGGFLEEDGEMWTADGVLLAQSRQLALML